MVAVNFSRMASRMTRMGLNAGLLELEVITLNMVSLALLENIKKAIETRVL
jgi:hypothetical protein